MFTDIANFTAILEVLEPETTVADLTLYTAILSQAVQRNQGHIDKFLGDGMLAFFDNASDAIRASCDIQYELESFNLNQEERGHPRFDTRIGLATGAILQAQLGFANRREFTIIGDRVNTAARLQGRAPIKGILMDAVTYEAAGEPEYSENEMYILKGKQQVEVAYSIEFSLIQQMIVAWV
jgi:class 3 adenylate cyclase